MGGNRSVCEISTSDTLFHSYSHITNCKPQDLHTTSPKLEGCTRGSKPREKDGGAALRTLASTSLSSLEHESKSERRTGLGDQRERKCGDVHTRRLALDHEEKEYGGSRSRRNSGGLSVAELTTQEETKTAAISKKELHEWFTVGYKRSAEESAKDMVTSGQERGEEGSRPLKKLMCAREGGVSSSEPMAKLEVSSSSSTFLVPQPELSWERRSQSFEYPKAEEAAGASMRNSWNPPPRSSFGVEHAGMANYPLSASMAQPRFHLPGLGFSQFQGNSNFHPTHSQEQQAFALRGVQGHVPYGVRELGQLLPLQEPWSSSLSSPAVRSMSMPWMGSQFLHPQSFSYSSSGAAPMTMTSGTLREDAFTSHALPFSMWKESPVGFQGAAVPSATQLSKDEAGRHSKYCHFCQHVKSTMAACSSPQCTFKFCHNCISVHLMEDWDAVLRAEREKAWKCPCCRYRCCCCSSKTCTAKHPHCKAYRKRQQTRVNVVEGGE